jgi:hypothetical protein
MASSARAQADKLYDACSEQIKNGRSPQEYFTQKECKEMLDDISVQELVQVVQVLMDRRLLKLFQVDRYAEHKVNTMGLLT